MNARAFRDIWAGVMFLKVSKLHELEPMMGPWSPPVHVMSFPDNFMVGECAQ